MTMAELIANAESDQEDLVSSLYDLLSDMGKAGKCVCDLAKAKARIAIEPFLTFEDPALDFTMADAKAIVEACDGPH